MRHVVLVADLGFGDAGKGTIVDFLARRHPVHTVVRYNGGAQAAHNVITPDGRHHTFSQFGSATFVPGVRTHLSRYMMINPLNMMAEDRDLQAAGITGALDRITIERDALITTPFQQAVNRLRELSRGNAQHGTCGLGIGETMADFLAHGEKVLFARDLLDTQIASEKLAFLQRTKHADIVDVIRTLPRTDAVLRELAILEDPDVIAYCLDRYAQFVRRVPIVDKNYLAEILATPGMVVFEGAQGVLLDEWYGFHPHTTWSTITFANAARLLAEAKYDGQITRLGVLRTYFTRHGAGPFVTEDAELTRRLQEDHNGSTGWQGQFRFGWFDLVAACYALEVIGGIDALAITHLDRLPTLPKWLICDGYLPPNDSAHLPAHFRVGEGVITGINVKSDLEDLDYQEVITRQLFDTRPRYREVDNNRNEYLALIGRELGIPIALGSSGPTANDKIVFDIWHEIIKGGDDAPRTLACGEL